MAYDLVLSARARRELGQLDPVAARRLLRYLHESVAPLDDPRQLGRALTGPLNGLWRYRVGDYRVIVQIDDEQFLIVVLRFGHRSSIYRS